MCKEDSIKLSKEHGLKPTIPLCFWCGEPKDEIILCGELKDDKKAPTNLVSDYEFCNKCKEKIGEDGCVIIPVSSTPNMEGQPAIIVDDNGDKQYPTGETISVPLDVFKEILLEYFKLPEDEAEIYKE